MCLLDVIELRGQTFFGEGLGDGARHLFRRMPHGVEDDDGLVFQLARTPLLVGGEDIGDMGAPEPAVPRGDHLDVDPCERFQGRLCLAPVEHEDVRIVLLRLFHEYGEVHFIVEELGSGKVLTESVVREEDLLFGAVGDHAVGPVEHGRRHERERALAEAQCVARLDAVVGKIAVVGGQSLEAVGIARVDFRLGAKLHHRRDGTRVIGLDMVRDDDVDLGRVDDGGDA